MGGRTAAACIALLAALAWPGCAEPAEPAPGPLQAAVAQAEAMLRAGHASVRLAMLEAHGTAPLPSDPTLPQPRLGESSWPAWTARFDAAQDGKAIQLTAELGPRGVTGLWGPEGEPLPTQPGVAYRSGGPCMDADLSGLDLGQAAGSYLAHPRILGISRHLEAAHLQARIRPAHRDCGDAPAYLFSLARSTPTPRGTEAELDAAFRVASEPVPLLRNVQEQDLPRGMPSEAAFPFRFPGNLTVTLEAGPAAPATSAEMVAPDGQRHPIPMSGGRGTLTITGAQAGTWTMRAQAAAQPIPATATMELRLGPEPACERAGGCPRDSRSANGSDGRADVA